MIAWIALGLLIVLALAQNLYMARKVRMARDCAVRCAVAVVTARQSARQAEEAAGMMAWPRSER